VGTIVDQAQGGIGLEYRGTRVQQITQTSAVFWNGGREPMRGEDVVPQDPIVLSVPGNILRVDLVEKSGEGLELEQTNDNGVVLRFDTLKRNDGARVEFIHDGADHKASIGGRMRDGARPLPFPEPRRYQAVLLIPILGGLPELLMQLNVVPDHGAFKWIFAASLVLFLVLCLANYEGIVEAEHRSERGMLWTQKVPVNLRESAQSFRDPPKEL
jgi:hypothetical protein